MAYGTKLFQPNNTYNVLRNRNREEWLKARAKGIGGSDSSATTNDNPYKNAQQLYREKKGLTIPEDISDKPVVIYGQKAEESIRRLFQLDFQDKYTVHYLKDVVLQNKEHEFMLYSPDGLLEEIDTGRKGILEIKTTTIMRAGQSDQWKNQIPMSYYVQVIHGLIVTGFDFVELRVNIKFDEYFTQVKTYHIERTEILEDINYVQEGTSDFWNNNYLKDIEPNYIMKIGGIKMFEIIVQQQQGSIEVNFSELESSLLEMLAPYKNRVITADMMGEAKEARATLNKVLKSIEDKRKDIKKQFLEPYNNAEASFKKLEVMVKEQSVYFDNIVKEVEQYEKNEKAIKIREFFNQTGFVLVEFSRISDEKWLNKGTTEKAWKEQLSSRIEKIKCDLAMVEKLDIDDHALMKSMYLKYLSLDVAMKDYELMQESKKAVEVVEPVAVQTTIAVTEQPSPVQKIQQQAPASQPVTQQIELYTRTFTIVDCTEEQLIALGNFMYDNGINFKKVEDKK